MPPMKPRGSRPSNQGLEDEGERIFERTSGNPRLQIFWVRPRKRMSACKATWSIKVFRAARSTPGWRPILEDCVSTTCHRKRHSATPKPGAVGMIAHGPSSCFRMWRA